MELDGSMGEGGGQVFRMALSYSAILGVPIHITRIRASRSKPGLRPQHLSALKAAAQLSGAEVQGGRVGSTEVTFKPGRLRGGRYTFNIGTAGSIPLLFQCIDPIVLHCPEPSQVWAGGGTAVTFSPPLAFLEHVVYPAFAAMGARLRLRVLRHGFYPRGGGRAVLEAEPLGRLEGFKPGAPSLKEIRGLSLCGRLPRHVAERQARSARHSLEALGVPVYIEALEAQPPPLSPGSVICLWAVGEDLFIGADSLGARGVPAEEVGRRAALKLLDHLKAGAHVDPHTADHLVVLSSLARGETRFKTSALTSHINTALELAELFTGRKPRVSGGLDRPAEIVFEEGGR